MQEKISLLMVKHYESEASKKYTHFLCKGIAIQLAKNVRKSKYNDYMIK